MGLIDIISGNAKTISAEDAQASLSDILIPNEIVHRAYKLVRDMIIFTNLRIIFIDKQGITGKKTDVMTIPYKSITFYSFETAGSFDYDAEMKIYISGSSEPIEKTLSRSVDIEDLQKTLTWLIFNK